MARAVCLDLFSITEAAGATQKSDIQEWPFPGVSELPFASVYFGGAVQRPETRGAGGARDLGGFGSYGCLARKLEWRDFPVISTRKSINTRHHKPPLRGGRGASRPARPWDAGGGRPQTRERNGDFGKIRGLTGDCGANKSAKNIIIHTYSALGNNPVTWG